MPNRCWLNGLTSGLIGGICLAVVVLLFLSGPQGEASNQIDQASNQASQANDESSDSRRQSWWIWDGALVTSRDTLAQWIMMAFTVIAAGLLLGTLLVTQGMARETTRIGEAEVRAYLSLHHIEAVFVRDEMEGAWSAVRLRPHFINTGASPAYIAHLTSDAKIVTSSTESVTIGPRRRVATQLRIGSQRTFFAVGGEIPWTDLIAAQEHGARFAVLARVEFGDVFGAKFVEDFSVYAGFSGRFTDRHLPLEEQPRVEWYDARLHLEWEHEHQG